MLSLRGTIPVFLDFTIYDSIGCFRPYSLSVTYVTSANSIVCLFVLPSWALTVPCFITALCFEGYIHLHVKFVSKIRELEQVHEQEGEYIVPVDLLLGMMRTWAFQNTPETSQYKTASLSLLSVSPFTHYLYECSCRFYYLLFSFIYFRRLEELKSFSFKKNLGK